MAYGKCWVVDLYFAGEKHHKTAYEVSYVLFIDLMLITNLIPMILGFSNKNVTDGTSNYSLFIYKTEDQNKHDFVCDPNGPL